MEVFIDKNFVRNYWASNGEQRIRDEFQNNFLKHSNLFTITTNYESIEEIRANDDDMLLFELLFEGVPKMIYDVNISSCENLSEITKKGGFRIFFDEQNSENHKSLEENSGYRFISTQSLDEKWGLFMQIKDFKKSISLPVDPHDSDVFNSWSDLKIAKEIPTNSILIVDRYILSGRARNRLKDNLFPLIENILPSNFRGTLYVSILAEEILSEERNSRIELKAQTIYQQLNSHFARYKDMKIKFSIIHHNKQFYPVGNPDIHFRVVYTNYFKITSESGFDLFHSKVRRSVLNSTVEMEFNLSRFSMKVLSCNIKALKSYMEKVRRIETIEEIFKQFPDNALDCPLLN